MGNIEIDKNRMTVEVNSEKRAKTVAGEIKKRLKDKAVYKNTVFTSMEKLMEETRDETPSDESGMSQDELMQMPEIREKIAEMARDHWEGWLDTKLPALGDMSPRQAVKDPVGRDKLEGLLLDIEASEQRNPGQNAFSPDVKKLRRTLGMDDS